MQGFVHPSTSSVEVYGFVGWITSLVVCVIYLLWSLIPNELLERAGVAYYPDKHWALTVPMLLSFIIAYVFISYEFVNMTLVQDPMERSTIEDRTPQWTEEELKLRQGDEDKMSIPPLKDLPPDYISRKLYLRDTYEQQTY